MSITKTKLSNLSQQSVLQLTSIYCRQEWWTARTQYHWQKTQKGDVQSFLSRPSSSRTQVLDSNVDIVHGTFCFPFISFFPDILDFAKEKKSAAFVGPSFHSSTSFIHSWNDTKTNQLQHV